jgi:hypothetical protein
MITTKSLKAKNRLVIGSVLMADALMFFFVSAAPKLSLHSPWSFDISARLALAVVIPLVALLLGSLLPASIKSILVFWRIKQVLPAHRAFEEKILSDPRIDRARLQKNVGAFPANPIEQNAMWYRLFKKVENEISIDYAHGQFLLLRDLGAISALLLPICLLCWITDIISTRESLIFAGILGAQFLLSAISAQSQGTGLVSSVLALHGAKRRV